MGFQQDQMEGGGADDNAPDCRRRHSYCCPGGSQPEQLLDSEGKACRLRLLSTAAPHMRSFHLAWATHFMAVFATFTAAPLLPVIRGNLDLTKTQVSAAGIAAVSGTIVSRVLTGGVCDRWGPRAAAATIQLLTASASFGMAVVGDGTGYITARLFIGFSPASFVPVLVLGDVQCQVPVALPIPYGIVGTANAVAAGWGNSAGGVVQLVMPLLLEALSRSQPDFVAWRCCYLIVGWMQVLVGIAALVWGQDLPAGNYGELRARGDMQRANSAREYWSAARNYRTWVMALVYGFSFGMELTMNNVLAQYLYDTFNTSLTAAGALASVFGFVNLFSRPAGGILSDLAARRFGMRGRLWVLYLLQSSAAAFCCGLSQMGASLGGSMAMVACMALTVTAAAGATFGIIPFISRRGLGAANGIVGSGNSVGSILLQGLFFTGSQINWSQGFLYMGIMALGMTMLLFLIRFPMWGGMLPSSLVPGHKQQPGEACEEAYYSADFTAAERRLGMHTSVLRFAAESRSQRGSRCFGSVEVAAEAGGEGDGTVTASAVTAAVSAAATDAGDEAGAGMQQQGTLPPPVQPSVKRMRLESPPGSVTVSTGAAGSSGVTSTPATPTAANASTAAASPHSMLPASVLCPPAFCSAASPALSGGVPGSPPAAGSSAASGGRSANARGSRGSLLSAEEKVQRLLERFPQSFCQELQIDIASGSPAALWQWLCASVLFSARIKSGAALNACLQLFAAGLTTPQAVCTAGEERVRSLLAAGGYDRPDDKAAAYLVENAEAMVQLYQGDLTALRAAAGNNAQQERTLLKKLKGTGDGAAQQPWEELFPFSDKKALKAARLALADLCGGDRQKARVLAFQGCACCHCYASLLAALVRVDMTKSYHEF
ncbi:hypothetical protein CHLNCDRAFT_138674 [Chlorella variabilis]|uniref:Major facilitator superfamily (MFS) profile domain-containing protein n=1 Tax=Chlorella variabilis TaxID=554065 RepID=E1ZNI5_CHLVA|nr:hypothetical protein CHLNCDRAFT_138674 [Chlorella variabilis]EFN52689.1 hypothetical protein CHLNCDRAFT_138674 [Chlorella variabilis]|eukprot:XP_005844791.1 hypothetical protein CHLNCDRAFT_138674 [Chlorella variabilis]